MFFTLLTQGRPFDSRTGKKIKGTQLCAFYFLVTRKSVSAHSRTGCVQKRMESPTA